LGFPPLSLGSSVLCLLGRSIFYGLLAISGFTYSLPFQPVIHPLHPFVFALLCTYRAVLTSWLKEKKEQNRTEQFVSQVATFSTFYFAGVAKRIFFFGYLVCLSVGANFVRAQKCKSNGIKRNNNNRIMQKKM